MRGSGPSGSAAPRSRVGHEQSPTTSIYTGVSSGLPEPKEEAAWGAVPRDYLDPLRSGGSRRFTYRRPEVRPAGCPDWLLELRAKMPCAGDTCSIGCLNDEIDAVWVERVR